MIAEIKFRGKRKDNGEWIEGSYVFDMGKHYILCKENKRDYRVAWFEVIPETVGQLIDSYVELEIYVGDLFKHPDGTIFMAGYYKGVTAFRAIYKDGTDLLLQLQFGYRGFAEHIGNIHDNPELWEAGK